MTQRGGWGQQGSAHHLLEVPLFSGNERPFQKLGLKRAECLSGVREEERSGLRARCRRAGPARCSRDSRGRRLNSPAAGRSLHAECSAKAPRQAWAEEARMGHPAWIWGQGHRCPLPSRRPLLGLF